MARVISFLIFLVSAAATIPGQVAGVLAGVKGLRDVLQGGSTDCHVLCRLGESYLYSCSD